MDELSKSHPHAAVRFVARHGRRMDHLGVHMRNQVQVIRFPKGKNACNSLVVRTCHENLSAQRSAMLQVAHDPQLAVRTHGPTAGLFFETLNVGHFHMEYTELRLTRMPFKQQAASLTSKRCAVRQARHAR